MKRFALYCAGALATLAGCADSPGRALGPDDTRPSATGGGGGYTWTITKELKRVTDMADHTMNPVAIPVVIPDGEIRWFEYKITWTRTEGGTEGPTAVITDDGAAACASLGPSFTCTSPIGQFGSGPGGATLVPWTYTASGSGNSDDIIGTLMLDVEGHGPCGVNATLTNTATLNAGGGVKSSTVRTAVMTPACPPPPGPLAGCTPGYWKQSQHFDSWVGYTRSTLVTSVFVGAGDARYGLGGLTLLGALQGGGGSSLSDAARILLRAATAALLNTSNGSFSYQLTASQLTAQVNAALATGNRNAILTLAATLDGYNNAGCPLN